MSVVVRSSSGQLLLFCKGADSVIYERLSATGNEFRGVSFLPLPRLFKTADSS